MLLMPHNFKGLGRSQGRHLARFSVCCSLPFRSTQRDLWCGHGTGGSLLTSYRNLANRGHFPFVGRVSRRLRIHKTLCET